MKQTTQSSWLIPQQQYFAKTILIILVTSLLISCKKTSPQGSDISSNNEFNAIAILSSGDTIKINVTGSKAAMGCGLLGSGTFVNGTNAANAAIYLSVFINSSNSSFCVSTSGTYYGSIEFRNNVVDPNTPIYGNHTQGSITFTSVSSDFLEGYFSANCPCISVGCGLDSVFVKGTFKGKF